MEKKLSTLETSEIEIASAALSDLFAVEHEPMLRMATLIVGSVPLAEEVVQDAFAVVGERWFSLDRPGGYLRTTVVNGCAQVLRRRKSESKANRLSIETATAELPSHSVELRESLDQLSDRQRLVIVLRYFIDIPDDEIAEMLGVRPSTVRSLTRRALAVLRKELL